MIKGIGICFWIAIFVMCGFTASASVAQDPSTLAAAQEEVGPESEALDPTAPPELPGVEIAPPAPPPPPGRAPRRDRSIVRFGVDYAVEANETVEELVVFGGAATIHGEVERDLVVIGGSAEISETGSVGGDLVVVGGNVTILQGATVDGDMVVVGGALDSPAGFAPGGEQVVGVNIFGDADLFAAVVPWVSRGLLGDGSSFPTWRGSGGLWVSYWPFV